MKSSAFALPNEYIIVFNDVKLTGPESYGTILDVNARGDSAPETERSEGFAGQGPRRIRKG